MKVLWHEIGELLRRRCGLASAPPPLPTPNVLVRAPAQNRPPFLLRTAGDPRADVNAVQQELPAAPRQGAQHQRCRYNTREGLDCGVHSRNEQRSAQHARAGLGGHPHGEKLVEGVDEIEWEVVDCPPAGSVGDGQGIYSEDRE